MRLIFMPTNVLVALNCMETNSRQAQNGGKHMKLVNQRKNNYLPMNLQLFADGGDSDDNAGDEDGDDDQDEQSEEKTFTQAELDEAIRKRLERERKKAEKKQTVKKDKSEDDPADKKAAENNEKLTALEEKVLCYDHGIDKEYSKEAIALAKAYLDDDTDMDEAITKVIKKFPQFVKGAKDEGEEDETETKSWGQRQKSTAKKIDPVEAAFLKRNPGLTID